MVDGDYTFPVGLDNVYRIIDSGRFVGALPDHNHAAYKGRWLDEKTFQITARSLEEGIEFISDFHFENNRVEMINLTNIDDQVYHLKGKLKR